jgi:hypothetical protein
LRSKHSEGKNHPQNQKPSFHRVKQSNIAFDADLDGDI